MESQDPSTSEIASQTSCLDHCDMLGLKTSRLSPPVVRGSLAQVFRLNVHQLSSTIHQSQHEVVA